MTNSDQIPNLNVADFMAQYEATDNAVLLDVRTAKEIADGMISGADHIDFLADSFQDNISKLDKDKSYFIYCRSGRRSMNACIAMQQIGINKTVNLDGGYLAYEASK